MPDPDSTPTKKTGIVLLNMGGPADLESVGPFLEQVFDDREIIQLPLHRWLGPYLVRRRTPRLEKLYDAIGGGSPIRSWTEKQGAGLVERLDTLSPETAPHAAYIGFRYTPPFARDALRAMLADGVERAVAFSQYPQYSCATSGSSLNDLWKSCREEGLESQFNWSVLDRWPTHHGFLRSIATLVRRSIETYPEEERDEVLLLFSAHSIPTSIVDRGDPYPQECGASVQGVMEELGHSHEFILCFQSKIRPIKWLGPSTESVLRQLGKRGRRNVLVVPIAFTTDHIETLSEIDIEYGDLAREVGITGFRRTPAPNDDPTFLDALADLTATHLAGEKPCSPQYGLRCSGCTNPECRTILNPVAPYSTH